MIDSRDRLVSIDDKDLLASLDDFGEMKLTPRDCDLTPRDGENELDGSEYGNSMELSGTQDFSRDRHNSGSIDMMNESFDAEAPLKLEEGSWSPQTSNKTSMAKPTLRKRLTIDVNTEGRSSSFGSGHWDEIDNSILDSPISSQPSPTQMSSMSKVLTRNLSPQYNRKQQIGSTWSVTIDSLRMSRSTFECIEHLRTLCHLLEDIDKYDRVKYCKCDFQRVVEDIRKNPHVKFDGNDELFREVSWIMITYFDENPFNSLPIALICDVYSYLGVHEHSVFPSTCREWRMVSSGDEIWSELYFHRYLRGNPDSIPQAPRSNYKENYKNRLHDPELGDKVEVAWRGKFRLEGLDVYQGLAWWCAEIVDKHTSHGKYKIRYPGWESRWDEWVPRDRLRWAVERNTLCHITAGSVVELWCCGANVPGAWLESKVKKVRGNRYCINRVLTVGASYQSKPLWVDRERLRLVRYPADEENKSPIRSRSSSFNEFFFGSPNSRSSRQRAASASSLLSSASASIGEGIDDATHGDTAGGNSPIRRRSSLGTLLGRLFFGPSASSQLQAQSQTLALSPVTQAQAQAVMMQEQTQETIFEQGDQDDTMSTGTAELT